MLGGLLLLGGLVLLLLGGSLLLAEGVVRALFSLPSTKR